MKFAATLIQHISKCITAEKGKRFVYALVNILLIALALLSCYGAYIGWNIMFNNTFIGGLLIVIVCVVLGIGLIINGVIGQIILMFVNFIAMFKSEEKGYAISAFIISFLSIGGMIAAIIIFLI